MKINKYLFSIIIVSLIFLNSCNSYCDSDPACSLEPDSGVCMAAIPKYYFDPDDGQCKTFIWGGCNGVVPFNTLEECKSCECN